MAILEVFEVKKKRTELIQVGCNFEVHPFLLFSSICLETIKVIPMLQF